MGLKVNGRAKVWEKDVHEKYTDVKVTTSKKDKRTDEWETDFSRKVRFIGHAHTKARDLNEKDSIIIKELEYTYKWDNEQKRAYDRVIVWDFDLADASNHADTSSMANEAKVIDADFLAVPDNADSEGLPFN